MAETYDLILRGGHGDSWTHGKVMWEGTLVADAKGERLHFLETLVS